MSMRKNDYPARAPAMLMPTMPSLQGGPLVGLEMLSKGPFFRTSRFSTMISILKRTGLISLQPTVWIGLVVKQCSPPASTGMTQKLLEEHLVQTVFF